MGMSNWLDRIFKDLGPQIEDAEVPPPYVKGQEYPKFESFDALPGGDGHRLWVNEVINYNAQQQKIQHQVDERRQKFERAQYERKLEDDRDEMWAKKDLREARERRMEQQHQESQIKALLLGSVLVVAVIIVLAIFFATRDRATVVNPAQPTLVWGEIDGGWQVAVTDANQEMHVVRIEQQAATTFTILHRGPGQSEFTPYSSAATLDMAKSSATMLVSQLKR